MSTWYRIADGTGILARRAGTWLVGEGWQSLALRGGTVAFLAPYVLPPVLDELRGYPLAVPAATVAGLGAAWWAGRPQAAEDIEEDVEEQPEQEPAPAVEPGVFIGHVRTAIGTGKGVHLAALAEHLTRATGDPWTPALARAACEAAGLPVQRGVRMPGRAPSTGVKLGALPAPLPAPSVAPPGDVVPAGQGVATGAATATATPLAVEHGQGMTIIRDPAERRHYTVTKTP
ncbi:hypothetical protein EAO71_35175 [Streptomyces sp. ms191]|uniref:hypothetical protein n=1 Tax=Streptomyces sp. ms191 TaxID=1827978 RepID=UPI0011CDD833|nr:hypothetical protein [Streptomyces sp. ms191]TXS16070.1 hypothetical protein EAO71_35175 [Streptomyces sp. ms191]